MGSVLASVIILNYNGKDFLAECLEGALRQTCPSYEVIVVDNGSTDGSHVLVRDRFPRVRLHILNANLGFSAGNNRGIEIARGEYIALLNNDAVPEPDWLEELCRVMRQDQKVGICASRMMYYRSPLINGAGLSWTVWGNARAIGWGEECRDKYSKQQEVFGAIGGAALYRKSMLDEIGMFDEDFFLYREDDDLSFRAQLADYRCVYVPTAVVHHHCGKTSRRNMGARVFYVMRNTEYAFIKNMPGWLIAKYGWRHLFYFLTLNVFLILRGRGIPTLRADWAILKGLPRMLRKRAEIQRRRKMSIRRLESLIQKETFFGLVRRQRTRIRSSAWY